MTRVERRITPDQVETIVVDGRPLLELHPLQFEQTTVNDYFRAKVVQEYRILFPPAKREKL